MRKPVYKYDFVIDVELDKTDSKRFGWSSSLMSLKQKAIIVILKTKPSQQEVSE
jgi:hypothetical protein